MHKMIYSKAKVTTIIRCGLLVVLISSAGCIPFKRSRTDTKNDSYGEFKKQADTLFAEPKQLIADYRDMVEDGTVARVWMKPGFQLTSCHSIEVSPLANYSSFNYPWAEKRIAEGLKKIFNSPVSTEHGSGDVSVSAAILDMKPKKKLVSRLTPFEEDFTSIEMQLIIVEKTSQEVLCKLSHGKRTDDFKDAVNGMIKDLEKFFSRGIPKKP